MANRGIELKVGVFVAMCLVIIAVLMVRFSKGTNFVHPTYVIELQSPNIGGLRARASVLMSGVQVGTVSAIHLNTTNHEVTIDLKIYREFEIQRGARFSIEQFGFLGDQYVAIDYPRAVSAETYTNGETATADAPFNMQEFTRSATGFIRRVDDTVRKLNDAIDQIQRVVLNEQTLTNVSYTVGTLRQTADDAQAAVRNANQLVLANTAPIQLAVSNLVGFTAQLKDVARSGQGILDTNAPEIAVAISNLTASTATLANLLRGIESGRGLAGSLLKNEQLAANVSLISSNFALTSSNLVMTTSNLNDQGLWRFLFGFRKPPPPRTKSTP